MEFERTRHLVWEKGLCAFLDHVHIVNAADRVGAVHAELVGPHSRTWLVVLVAEIRGRWSDEARTFLRLLAKAEARSEPPLMLCRGGAGMAPALEFHLDLRFNLCFRQLPIGNSCHWWRR